MAAESEREAIFDRFYEGRKFKNIAAASSVSTLTLLTNTLLTMSSAKPTTLTVAASAYARGVRCGFGAGSRGLALMTSEMAARSCSAAIAPRKSVVVTCCGL